MLPPWTGWVPSSRKSPPVVDAVALPPPLPEQAASAARAASENREAGSNRFMAITWEHAHGNHLDRLSRTREVARARRGCALPGIGADGRAVTVSAVPFVRQRAEVNTLEAAPSGLPKRRESNPHAGLAEPDQKPKGRRRTREL